MKPRSLLAWALVACLLVGSTLPRQVAAQENEDGTRPQPLGLLKKIAHGGEGVDPGADQEVEEEEEDKPKETIAHILDEALKEEFSDEEKKKAEVGKQFNETVSREEGTTETVVIISQKKEKERAANRTADPDELGGTSTSGTSSHHHSATDTAGKDNTEELSDYDYDEEEESGALASGETDVDRIIDSKDNEYVLSKPNEEGSMGLTLDPRLIRDFSVLIGTCAAAGLAMEAVRQPTINGYFVAGSVVGPGGLGWVKEIVQVQSVAQLGVVLLLFTLGLELNLSKLRAVRDVALLGGALQVALMAALGGVAAAVIGTGTYQGAFVGAMLAMSSTSVVVKCLQDARAAHTPHAQITIGTLVLQDCVVGLLFAFMPVLAAAGTGGVRLGELLAVAGRVVAMLAVVIIAAVTAAKTALPALARAAARFSHETFLLTMLGFCLAAAMATTRLGVSAELGAFVAGVLLSITDQQEAVLAAVEPVAHLFLALFIASTGLTIPPAFMAEHLLVLAAVAAVVVTAKTLLISGVVLAFRFPLDVALAVGINLAQIGEFGFVLLSMASQRGIIASQVYLLLMGTTALSLLLTPFMLQLSVRLPKSKEGTGSTAAGGSGPGGSGGGGSSGFDDVEQQQSLMKRRNSGVSLFPVSPDSPVVDSPALPPALGGVTTHRHHSAGNGHLSRTSSGVEVVKSPQKKPSYV